MTKLLFCTDTDSGTITVLDLSNEKLPAVAKIPVGNGPRGPVKFTGTGRGFVANHAGNTLSEVDAYSLRELGRIRVGVAPIGVALVPGDRYALTSISGEDRISVVDLDARREIHTFSVGREPRHMDITPDGEFAYAAISGGDHVSKIRISALLANDDKAIPHSVREVGRIFLGDGTLPYSVAISPTGETALAANNQVDYVSLIDLTTDSVRHRVNVGTKGARGSAFLPDGSKVFVSLEDSSEVVAVDVVSGEVEQRFDVGPGPRGMIVDSDNFTIYASAFARTKGRLPSLHPNTVSVIDFGSSKAMNTLGRASPKLSEVSVGAGPCSVSMFVRV